MKKILIIKLGAQGDVLRTTSILHHFKNDEVYWLTKREALPLLKNNPYIKKVLFLDDQIPAVDLVLSLDDEKEACEIANRCPKIIGAYYDDGFKYTEESSGWFDMGLISKYGKEKADELKKKNTKSYQELLFAMIGKEFKGEGFVMNYPDVEEKNIIGIEERAGIRWKMKRWDKYQALAEKIKQKGYEVKVFQQRENLEDYIRDIAECKLVITGDTLAMNLALGLKKKAIAIFGPTSSAEIYDYGILKKIITPVGCKCCYKNDCEEKPNCMEAIGLDMVWQNLESLMAA